jgi:methionine-rich copper-binding protein CopC
MGLAILFSFSIQAVSADPGQLYVNTTSGNDDYNGESPVFVSGVIGPKKTIKNATKAVITDGTVHIASGIYNENGISDFSKNINFIGEDKYQTIIDGNKLGGLFSLGAQGVTYSYSFTNMQFRNGSAYNGGAIANTCGNILIDNCIFKNNIASYTGAAIYGFGTVSAPATFTVTNCNFTNNSASHGAIGIGLTSLSVTGSDFTSNTGATASILWSNFGTISNFQFNRIIGTGNLISSDSGGDVSLNWWGSNSDPSAKVTGVTLYNWLVLLSNSNPTTIATGQTSTVTANLLYDSGILLDPTNPDFYYHDPTFGHVPDGIVVNFATGALGTLNPLIGTMIDGAASTTFRAGLTLGTAVISSVVDSETSTSNVNIVQGSAPTITSTDPANGAVNVALNKVVNINFNQAIKLGQNPWIEFFTGTTSVPFTASVNSNTLTLIPDAFLKSGLLYNVIIHSNSVTSLVDIGLAAPYGFKFTTETGPIVTLINPLDNAVNVALNKVIQINFNKAIKFGNSWIELMNSNGNLIPIKTAISGGSLYITPQTILAQGTQYKVLLHTNSITDTSGTGIAAYTSKFTTATPPVVTLTNPLNNAINVALNKVIQINFNKAIKFGNSWIELTNRWGAKPFTTAISGSSLYITPKTSLAKGTQYTVTLHSNSLTDSTGTAGLAAPYTFRFTTV